MIITSGYIRELLELRPSATILGCPFVLHYVKQCCPTMLEQYLLVFVLVFIVLQPGCDQVHYQLANLFL